MAVALPAPLFGKLFSRRHDVLPGCVYPGFTLFYLSVIVLIPLAALVLRAAGIGWSGFLHVLSSYRVQAAFRVTFSISFLAAMIDMFWGLLVTWVLVRYRFPGRRLLDALVDLPIALPTAVAGITLTELYATNGWLGAPLARMGINVDFTWLGILVALTFVGLPFVVRTVEPVLADLDRGLEEAARTLGATPWQIFRRVLLPPLLPALMTGLTLAFGRAIGEYGSVIFIAGNVPGQTEIVPLLIVIKLEEYDYVGAAVLGSLMLVLSFALMFAINGLNHWSHKRLGQ